MAEQNPAVKVMIAGEEFSLKSDRSEDYTRAVADHIDRALKDVLAAAPRIDPHKAAVLAALAVTDELFQSRLEAREMQRRINEMTDNLSRFLPPKKRPSRTSGVFAQSVDDG
jgi:cell division protein ZapA